MTACVASLERARPCAYEGTSYDNHAKAELIKHGNRQCEDAHERRHRA